MCSVALPTSFLNWTKFCDLPGYSLNYSSFVLLVEHVQIPYRIVFRGAHLVAVKPRAMVVIVPWIEPKCTSIRHVPDRIPWRGVSPIGYRFGGVGLRGGEGALRKAIWIGCF